MKTVVITGSARGFGYSMAKFFREKNYNVVLCDINEQILIESKKTLETANFPGSVLAFKTDITKQEDIEVLISGTLKKLDTIDIWINNAGVNQPNQVIWELDKTVIDRMLDIDLKGTILCSKLIMPVMIKQGFGQIFNVEGHGSNDVKLLGLSIYGTSKRAVTYFTEALAFEAEEKHTNVHVGKITPGIMITNFITTSLGDGDKILLNEKSKKIYNILGDYPDTIAEFMVNKIINNTKNNVKFTWLTKRKASFRFMTAGFNKRNFFKD